MFSHTVPIPFTMWSIYNFHSSISLHAIDYINKSCLHIKSGSITHLLKRKILWMKPPFHKVPDLSSGNHLACFFENSNTKKQLQKSPITYQMLCEPFIHSDNILGNVPHDWKKAVLCIAHIVLQCGSLEQGNHLQQGHFPKGRFLKGYRSTCDLPILHSCIV